MTKEFESFNDTISIGNSVPEDAQMILSLIVKSPDALLDVSLEEIQEWIACGNSMVAKDVSGKVIGHQGMFYWEESGLVELRSAYVDSEYRGKGINTKMKKKMMEKAKNDHPDSKIIGFTEAASKSRGILTKLGFEELPLDDAPDELFSICPGNCYRKTGVDCGCKIFVLDPNESE